MKPRTDGMIPIGDEQEPAGDMEFPRLWKATLEIRDGEFEYGDEYFLRNADNEDEARKAAEDYVRHYFGDEEAVEYNGLPGWYEEPNGYRAVRLRRLQQINTLTELLDSLFVTDVK